MRNQVVFLVSFILASSPVVQAQLAPQGLTLQGRLLKPDSTALEGSSVSFTIQVLSPSAAGGCVLYEETYPSVNMTNSNGMFSLTLGAGTRSGSAFKDTSTLPQVFSNVSTAMNSLSCSSGNSYTPSSTDDRQIKISFDDGTGSGAQALSPNPVVKAVPYALVADSLQGKSASSFIQVKSSGAALTQANAEAVFASTSAVNELLALMAGTSTQYVTSSGGNFTPGANLSFNSKKITNLADPTSAQDAATKNYCDGKIAGSTADTTTLSALAAGDNGKVLTWNGTKWIAQSSSDTMKVSKAGDTMTGALTMSNADIVLSGSSKVSGQMSVARTGRDGVGSTNILNLTTDAKTTNDEVGMNFTMNNSSNSSTAYGMIYSGVTSSTAGSETGYVRILTKRSSGVTEAVRIDSQGRMGIATASPQVGLDLSGHSDALRLPAGSTAQRPSSAAVGDMRWNSTTSGLEYYNGSAWTNVALGYTPINKAGDTGVGSLTFGAANIITLTDSGTNTVGLQAPTAISTSYVLKLPTAAPASNGQVLTGDTSGNLTWTTPSAGATTNVSVTSPITNSGSSTTPTIGIQQADSTHDGYLSQTDWGTFNSKLGTSTTFSGDVSGTYNATSVDKIKGKAVTAPTLAGQVLRYDGTAITPNFVAMTDLRSKVTGTQALSSTCTAAQTLTYDSSTDSLACSNIAIDGSQISAGTLSASRLPASVLLNGGNAFGAAANVGTTDAQALNLVTNNTAKMTVTSTGNVGIGTTGPASLLDIQGATNGATYSSVKNNDTGSAVRAFGRFSNGTNYLDVGSYGTGHSSYPGVSYISTGAATPLQVQIGGVDVMNFATSGNVGVGVTSPSATMQVVAGSGSDLLKLSGAGGASAESYYLKIASRVPGSGNVAFDFIQKNNASDMNVMTFESNGNVGLGTTAPTTRLDLGTLNSFDSGLKISVPNPTGDGSAAVNIGVSDATGWWGTTSGLDQALLRLTGPGDGSANGGIHTGSHAALIDLIGPVGNSGVQSGTLIQGRATPTSASTTFHIRYNGDTYLGGKLGIGVMSAATSLDLSNRTDAVYLPKGTTAQQPSSPGAGMFRYNTDNSALEFYNGSAWTTVSTGGGSYLSSSGGTLSGALTISSGGASISGGINTNSGAVTNVGSIAGNSALTVAAGGTNQNLTLSSSGTGSVSLASGNGTQAKILDGGTSTVNYVTLKGAATGSAPIVGVDGSDTNIDLKLLPKGTGNTIIGSGNVGIGTTSPSAILDVSGSGENLALNRSNSSGYGGVLRMHGSRGSVTSKTALQSGDTAGTVIWGGYDGTSNIDNGAIQGIVESAVSTGVVPIALQFLTGTGTGGVERMRITSAGNIAIGTSAPGANNKLQILAPNRALATDDSANLVVGTSDAAAAGLGGSIGFAHSGAAGPVLAVIKGAKESSGTNNGALLFATRSDSVFATERMRLTSTGNLGIGTTSPGAKLTVSGGVAANNFYQGVSDTTAQTGLYSDDSFANGWQAYGSTNGSLPNSLMAVTSGTPRMIVNGSGKVGIGNATPNVLLDVLGSPGSPATSGTTQNGIFRLGQGSTNNVMDFGSISSSPWTVWIQSANRGGLNTNNAFALNPNGGSVGIGTLSPSYLFHVNTSNSGVVAGFTNSAGTCTLTPSSSAANWSCTSDETLKKDIAPISGDEVLDRLMALQAVTYVLKKGDDGSRHTGYIAQKVQEIAPEFVTKNAEGLLQVSYTGFIPWITEAIKTLHLKMKVLSEDSSAQSREIASLKDENNRLKEENRQILERLGKIESLIEQKVSK